ncbi:unnamed protein product [Paramecium pentaurelia]|uniref:Protein kinase domain-containing protein n=1 Tax=Paramecium pentaurelia TaxID=43138 RepID=A0A8S1UHX7_9CILI|nr:unnamed protein product [Paramecium pentaurelia]
MKYSNPKKLSIHLDFAAFKAEFQNSLPSSTKKISTQPNSPNGITKNIKTQQPLILVQNSLSSQNILSPQQKKSTDFESTFSKFPLLVDQFVKLYNLSKSETGELTGLKQVYYYKPQKISSEGPNGDYLAHPKDHVRYQYEIIQQIGSGSFGHVFEVIDHKTKNTVALKIIRNQDNLKKQAQVETNILLAIQAKDPMNIQSIVKLQDHFTFRGHQCLVFEKLDCTLFEMLKYQLFRGFDYETLKKIAYQIVKGLIFLRQCNIVHCDLKPENIMISDMQQKIIKIVDFGTGCFEGNQFYTYIQSRYYRAPEVFFGLKYGYEIDMWSLACVIVELHTGKPLFPGENEVDQFNLIMEVIGIPKVEFALKCPRKKMFFDDQGHPKKTIKQYRKPKSINLNELLKTTEEDLVDFIQKCLVWEPELRMKANEAIQHPWIKGQALQEKNKVISFRNFKENQINKITKQQFKESFDKKIMGTIEKTKALIAHNKNNSQPTILNSARNQELSSFRQRQQMVQSIHQILRQTNTKKSSFIRKPSIE